MIPENVYRALALANPWWENRPIPPQFLPAYERPQLSTVTGYQRLGRIVMIKGPRRTGKTTLLYQYINHLINEHVNPRQIFLVSFEDPALRLPLQNLLDAYHVLASPSEGEKFLFWDEIQSLPDWSAMAKVIVDRDRSYHLVVSGSSATLLARSSESLAGRSIEETLLPFSPREMLNLQHGLNLPSGNGDLATRLTYDPSVISYLPQIKRAVKLYFERGGFPHLFDVQPDSLWLELLRTDIIQKAIYKDLADLYQVKDPGTLERLFLYLAETTASIANVTSIAGQLKLSRATLTQYLQFLKNTYLVHALPKYSNYPKEILKSQEKIHLIDPGLARLGSPPPYSSLLESAIVSLLLRQKAQHLYYWRQNYEVDCVVEQDNRLIPIEIKSSLQLPRGKDIRGLTNFMEKYEVRTGYVIYPGEAHSVEGPAGHIHFLPDWYVLTRL